MEARMASADEPPQLLVKNIPPSYTDEMLTLYFERAQIFGQSLSVVDVNYDEDGNSAVITFESLEDVQIVLDHHQSEPCCLKGRKLVIEVHSEDSTKTIEVQGYPTSQHTDTLRYYFENRRQSGGGLVEDVSTQTGEHDVIYVTFVDAAAVKGVIRKAEVKEHVVSGFKLSIRPIYMSKTEICLSNLPADETEETLRNFLEAKLQYVISMVTYNCDRTKAVVKFDTTVDFVKVQDKLSKHQLGGHTLSVAKVPITNCILATNLPESASEDGCKFYFENKHKSGGGETTKVVYCAEGCFCLVYFVDVKDVQTCCSKKSHIFLGSELTVVPHHSCLGSPVVQEPYKFQLPEPLTVDEAVKMKLKLLKNDTKRKEQITERLEALHAKLLWKKGPMKIECTLNEGVENFRTIAETWQDSCMTLLDELVSDVEMKKFHFEEVLLEVVKAGLEQVVMPHPEDCAVVIDKDKNAVVLVSCNKHTFEDSCEKISEIVKHIQEAEYVKANQKTKTQQFKTWQVEYLDFICFDKTLSERYDHLEIKFDVEHGTVRLQGLDTSISSAIINMWEKLQSVREHEIEIEHEVVTLLENQAIRKDISKTIKRHNLLDLWKVNANSISFVVQDDSDVGTFKRIIDRYFDKLDIPLDSNAVFQDTAKLDELLDILSDRFRGDIVTVRDKMLVTIHTLPKHMDGIQDQIDQYLRIKSIFEETLKLDENKLKFVQKFMGEDVTKKLTEIKRDHELTVTYRDGAVVHIKGTKDGVKKARKLFKNLEKSVVCEQHKLDQPGVNRYLSSTAGKDALTNMERSRSCFIHVKMTQTVKSVETFLKGVRCAEVVLPTGQKITVYGGNMALLRIDVLVNASNMDMKHAGGLAAAIVKTGGQSIQDECSDHVKNNGTLNVGEVFMGKPGSLQCKAIAHAVGPKWQGGNKGERKDLMGLVTECLRQTEQRKMASIAFPALCTGMFRYPVDKSCIDIVTGIIDYLKNNKSSSITEVFLCDINVKTVNGFVTALKRKVPNVTDLVELDQAVLNSQKARQTLAADKSDRKSKKANPTFQVGATVVELVKGDMAYEKVDIIVNSTSADLNHNKGRASKALLKVGGSAIQTESSQKYPNGINFGDVGITSGGQLKCQEVFHVAVKPHAEQNSVQILQTAINNCLTNADTLQRTSLAFPAIGTGAQGFPKDIAADTLLNCCATYCTNTPGTSLKHVRVVVFKGDTETYDAFDPVFKKYVVQYPTKPVAVASDTNTTTQQPPKTTMHLGSTMIGSKSSTAQETSCMVTVYASRQVTIKRVLGQLEKLIKDEWYTQKIEDNAVWKLDQTQIQRIDKCASDNNVYVCVDQDIGVITVEGLVNDASGVMDVICEELRVIDRNQHEFQHALLKAKIVRWSYSDGTKNIQFSELESYRIEMAHSNKAKTVRLKNASGQEYEIDLKSTKMHFLANAKIMYNVYRRDMVASSFKLHTGWDPMNPGEQMRKVNLPATSSEYQTAVAEFTRTLGRIPNILSVERVQNPYLYSQYDIKRAELAKKNPGIQNEHVLWHGTDVNAIQNIITNGFNRSYLNFGAHGSGVYFAVNSSYSDQGYAKVDANGHKRMLRTLVLVGQSTRGVGGMAYLPERAPGILYDSASGPSMYIIFNDTQAYAQHIITYT